MKKIYTLIAATAIVFSANAQRSMTNANNPAHKLNGFAPKYKASASTDRMAGDSLFWTTMDYYGGTGIDGTFNLMSEDLDGKNCATALAGTGFDPTSDFVYYYELLPTPGDTNIYVAANSWFNPVGQADDWLEFGPIAIPAAGATFHFGDVYNDPSYRDGYEILVSTTGMSNVTDFTDPAVYTITDNDPMTVLDTAQYPNNQFVDRSVDISAYAGQSVYLAIHHNANDMFIYNMDNLYVVENGTSGVGITEYTNGINVYQSTPNPASTVSAISYDLQKDATVALSVFDVTGKLIASQNEGSQAAGRHVLKFNVENLSAGVYYYSVAVNNTPSSTMKMVVVK